MSAGIEYQDKIVSIIGKEWHGLAEYREDLKETGIPFDQSRLNYELVAAPIQTIMLDGAIIDIPSHKSIVCSDNNYPISVVKESYTIIQNSQIFETIMDSLTGIDYRIVCCGSLHNRKKVFFSVELKDAQEYMVNREQFQNHLTFASGHDGSMAFEAFDCSTRVVCQNTLNWSRRQKKLLNLKVYHTKNSSFKIVNMTKHIEELLEKREEFYQTYAGFCARPITLEKAEQILAGWITPSTAKNGDKISTRAFNQVGDILGLFKSGAGNKGETLGDLLNGVTDYYTNQYSNDSAKRFASNFGGSADNSKLDFFELLTDGDLDVIADRGEKLLSEYTLT